MAITHSFDAPTQRVHYPATARLARAAQTSTAKITANSAASTIVYGDIHPGVYKAFVGCWAALIAVFVATFAESAYTLYMLAVVIGYAIMFFGVPTVMSRMAPPDTSVGKASFWQFLHGEVDTLYGRVSGIEALTQVIMVPLGLTLGAIVIGSIVHFEANHIHMLYVGQTAAFPR
jgi:hypothetical protein